MQITRFKYALAVFKKKRKADQRGQIIQHVKKLKENIDTLARLVYTRHWCNGFPHIVLIFYLCNI